MNFDTTINQQVNIDNLKRMKGLKHIIFDIDYTLIDSDVTGVIYPRPYIKEILDFCFDNFESVSIWTAGDKQWYNIVKANVFDRILSPDKMFKNVFTNRQCRVRKDILNQHEYYKPLSFLYFWNSKFNSSNTLIVDDTASTFTQNRDNAYHISRYEVEDPCDDEEFLKLMNLLKEHCM